MLSPTNWRNEKHTLPLTERRLREALRYNHDTGVFTWRINAGYRNMIGKRAGEITARGYVRIMIDGQRYQGSWLAWLYIKGRWPKAGCELDHKDRQRSNNAFTNLRECTSAQNRMNSSYTRATLHRVEVTWIDGKYVARFWATGRRTKGEKAITIGREYSKRVLQMVIDDYLEEHGLK